MGIVKPRRPNHTFDLVPLAVVRTNFHLRTFPKNSALVRVTPPCLLKLSEVSYAIAIQSSAEEILGVFHLIVEFY